MIVGAKGKLVDIRDVVVDAPKALEIFKSERCSIIGYNSHLGCADSVDFL